jgi:hypothetical protein
VIAALSEALWAIIELLLCVIKLGVDAFAPIGSINKANVLNAVRNPFEYK